MRLGFGVKAKQGRPEKSESSVHRHLITAVLDRLSDPEENPEEFLLLKDHGLEGFFIGSPMRPGGIRGLDAEALVAEFQGSTRGIKSGACSATPDACGIVGGGASCPLLACCAMHCRRKQREQNVPRPVTLPPTRVTASRTPAITQVDISRNRGKCMRRGAWKWY